MRLIDADELTELLNWTFAKPPFSRKTVQKIIDMARTIDAVPVRHGKWEKIPSTWGSAFACSECGEKAVETVMGKPRANYCPNCGARMDAA